MNKKTYQELINYCMDTGADYSDIFYEKTNSNTYKVWDSKLNSIETSNYEGIGIRLSSLDNIYYGHTNKLTKSNIYNIINGLKSNINSSTKNEEIKLTEKIYRKRKPEYISPQEIKNLLLKVDKTIRSLDKRVIQVNTRIQNITSKIVVASSNGNLSKENRYRTRFVISILVSENGIKTDAYYTLGSLLNKKALEKLDINLICKNLVDCAIKKLDVVECKGGMMNVILAPGFGGVIFHEACGHAMEATCTANSTSILSNKLNEKIASDKVTIIDDGTISNLWGSNKMDDEGNPTQKNILIKNGILKTFLVDELNSKKLGIKPNGCSRRANYFFAPTSRMNNTYLEAGNDSLEEMISSIKLGLYASKMGGGCVNTMTGDFNFAVTECFMIRDGKICEPVKSASLIGNTLDILKNIEMVSKEIEFADGYCGSISGLIPVTMGEPYIKVSNILVGGSK